MNLNSLNSLIISLYIAILKWLIFWGNLIDGIIGILSFCSIKTGCALEMSKYYSKTQWKYKNKYNNQTKER